MKRIRECQRNGFVDVRIPTPIRWQFIEAFVGLRKIDLRPNASGPEIELTFGTEDGELGLCADDLIKKEVERLSGCPVLAFRRRAR